MKSWRYGGYANDVENEKSQRCLTIKFLIAPRKLGTEQREAINSVALRSEFTYPQPISIPKAQSRKKAHKPLRTSWISRMCVRHDW